VNSLAAPKLWDKGYDVDPRIQRFEVGDDLTCDQKLVVSDAIGSVAHAAGLVKIGLLPVETFQLLRAELAHIVDLAEQGEFQMSSEDEDVHTKIENWLTNTLGEPGKMIHTGRSRNDQVVVDIRLFTRQAILPVYGAILDACEALLDLAQRHATTPMPGYTHMQRAMLSSVGVWAGAYVESLLDDLTLLDAAVALSDQSPLGSAASYGVGLPLDRQYVSDLLGFAKVHNNVLYAQHGRGKFELAIVQALAQVMLDLSKLAQDILLFTTSEFAFFSVDVSVTTGSSIMPQKKNLDAMELLRGKVHVIAAMQQQMLTILGGTPSGFNAEYQDTKRPFMEALDLVESSAVVAALNVSQLTPNEEKMLAACSPDLFATDVAYDLVQKGVPFRDAYRQVANMLDDLAEFDVQAVLAMRTHQGTSGDLRLDVSAEKIAERRTQLAEREAELAAIAAGLLDGSAADLPGGTD